MDRLLTELPGGTSSLIHFVIGIQLGVLGPLLDGN